MLARFAGLIAARARAAARAGTRAGTRFRDDRGATTLDYGLTVLLVAVLLLGVAFLLGGDLGAVFAG